MGEHDHNADPLAALRAVAIEVHDDTHDEHDEHGGIAPAASGDSAPPDEIAAIEDELPAAQDALSAYFADVGNGRLLTFDEELTLGRQVQTGLSAAAKLRGEVKMGQRAELNQLVSDGQMARA